MGYEESKTIKKNCMNILQGPFKNETNILFTIHLYLVSRGKSNRKRLQRNCFAFSLKRLNPGTLHIFNMEGIKAVEIVTGVSHLGSLQKLSIAKHGWNLKLSCFTKQSFRWLRDPKSYLWS
ncbi:hypothetical protein CEXT_707881 [Caerostris extrusa]|uniref:Uncharacterized protein n=1 Tax=Caerostris extrusa TaxID=172846 RepID=A0AAV4TUZ2_CAEEX|nr:hypothetical protein CEXT_707881 [Caerostris extrusa]